MTLDVVAVVVVDYSIIHDTNVDFEMMKDFLMNFVILMMITIDVENLI